MSAVVLTQSELQRIRKSVQPHDKDDRERHTDELRRLSQARQEQWPNTLEALRQRKEHWKKEKLERDELARQEIDKQEAEIRAHLRFQSIERAYRIIEQRTDKLKCLQSTKMLADVMTVRAAQIAENSKLKDLRNEQAKAEVERMFSEAAKLETIAAAKQRRIRKAAAEVAKRQQEQVAAVREKLAKEAEDQAREGREALERIEDELLEEERQKILKKQRAEEIARKLNDANIQAAHERQQQANENLAGELQCEKELAAIQQRAVARKVLEQQKFNQRQALRQRAIEKSTVELAKSLDASNERYEKQCAEAIEKEARNEAEKEALRVQANEEMLTSRTQQIAIRKKLKEHEIQESNRMAQQMRRERDELQLEELRKQEAQRQKVLETKLFLQTQIQEKKQKDATDRKQYFSAYEEQQAMAIREWQTYEQEVMKTIEDYEKQGKSTYALYRALNFAQPELLPVGGTKI